MNIDGVGQTGAKRFGASASEAFRDFAARVVRETQQSVDKAARVDGMAASGEADPLAQIAVLRPLHRVMYVPLNDHHPAPGITLGPLPGLAAGRILADDGAGIDRRGFAAPVLARERNRLIEAVDEALFMAQWVTIFQDVDRLKEAFDFFVEQQNRREGEEK